jgi:hypothetical protein
MAFPTEQFMHQLHEAMNQHYSEEARPLYELVHVLTASSWQMFHEFGLFEVMIDNVGRISYLNSKDVMSCLLEFFDNCDLDVAMVAAIDHGGFRVLCRMVAAVDGPDIARLLTRILQFWQVGQPFIKMS